MTTAEHVLQRRLFRFDESAELSTSGSWYSGDVVRTQLLNAYTILVPGGEQFIIRTCKKYLSHFELALRDELEHVFFQEASHSREHQRVLESMRAAGGSLDSFQSIVEWILYRMLEPLTPLKVRLATGAAIEHHNAVIATHFLAKDLMSGVQSGELRKLFLWHFAEEIEHKETVFKAFQKVSSSWLLRTVGLLFSCATFLLCLGIGTMILIAKNLSQFSLDIDSQRPKEHVGDSLSIALLKGSIRYLHPSFHPSLAESRALLDSALRELDRLGVAVPARQSKSTQRIMPLKFKAKLARMERRSTELQAKYPFFFEPIEGYEGAWLYRGRKRLLNFCTYSYLGLLGDSRIQDAARKALEEYGTGTQGVRLLGGSLAIHQELEATIASFFKREAAITFSSGFITNVAVIGTLVGKGDFILSDERNHASIADGCRLSGAEVIRFQHNDMSDLSAKISALPSRGLRLIVVDGVYSMDGDIAPLPELIKIRDRFPNTLLMVDEAHSFGVLGINGRGIEEHFGCEGRVDVLMGTLSKAVPCQGGYITGSHDLITHLRYTAHGFVFSAALSPITAAAAKESFKVIDGEGRIRRSKLMANVEYFTRRLREEGFDCGQSASAIIPVMLRNETLAFEVAEQCNQHEVYALPVIYPAVRKGTERLRMNVTYHHQREDIECAIRVLIHARRIVNSSRNYSLCNDNSPITTPDV